MTVTKGRGRSRNSTAIQAAVNAKLNRSSSSYIDMGSVAELYANLQAEFALSGGEVSSSLQSVPGTNEQARIQADISTLLSHIEERLSTCNEELAKVKRIGEVIQEERMRKKKKVKREFDDDKPAAPVRSGKSGKGTGKGTGKFRGGDKQKADIKKEYDDKSKNQIDRVKRSESLDSEPDRPLADQVNNRQSSGSGSGSGSTSGNSSASDSNNKNELTAKLEDVTPYKLEPVETVYDPPSPAKHSAADFAKIQAASIAALGLFDESILIDADGNESKDVEVLKKKYGVASYPKRNLKELLPGDIPDEDFTRAKPANQVQFSTFAAYIEPYFRPLTEEDISFLKHKSVGLDGSYTRSIASPYFIPPLGQLYTDAWAEEDGPVSNTYSLSPPPSGTIDESLFKGNGSEDSLNDDILDAYSTKLSVGPLASRLLSALLREPGEDEDIKEETKVKIEEDISTGSTPSTSNINSNTNATNSTTVTTTSTALTTTNSTTTGTPSKPAASLIDPAKATPIKADYTNLEERLKREFRYVGILDVNLLRKEDKMKKRLNGTSETNGTSATPTNSTGNDDDSNFEIDWANGTEDDEICYEIRQLQKKFKQVTKTNQACKRVLLPIVQEQMAYQEYSQILEDLDKQVDQAYQKRMRSMPKGKKKKGFASLNNTSSTPNAPSADQKPPSYKPLLEKRLRWIEKVGTFFKLPEIMKRTPEESIFSNIQIDEDDDDAEQGDDDDDMYNMTL